MGDDNMMNDDIVNRSEGGSGAYNLAADPAALASLVNRLLGGDMKEFDTLPSLVEALKDLKLDDGMVLFENVIPGMSNTDSNGAPAATPWLLTLSDTNVSTTSDTAGTVRMTAKTRRTDGTEANPNGLPDTTKDKLVIIIIRINPNGTITIEFTLTEGVIGSAGGNAPPGTVAEAFDGKIFGVAGLTEAGYQAVLAEAKEEAGAPEICFPANTPIKTDQGTVMIQDIDVHAHTINGRDIQYITKTKTTTDHLICFEKNAVRRGYPRRRTIMSREHCVVNNGKLYPAYAFVGKHRDVYKVPYTNETLYNILMEHHEIINVNGLKCETLHPENAVAQFYKQKYNLAVKSKVKTYLRTRDISALTKSELASLSTLLR